MEELKGVSPDCISPETLAVFERRLQEQKRGGGESLLEDVTYALRYTLRDNHVVPTWCFGDIGAWWREHVDGYVASGVVCARYSVVLENIPWHFYALVNIRADSVFLDCSRADWWTDHQEITVKSRVNAENPAVTVTVDYVRRLVPGGRRPSSYGIEERTETVPLPRDANILLREFYSWLIPHKTEPAAAVITPYYGHGRPPNVFWSHRDTESAVHTYRELSIAWDKTRLYHCSRLAADYLRELHVMPAELIHYIVHDYLGASCFSPRGRGATAFHLPVRYDNRPYARFR